jgi:ABC-type Fe3+-hydroxamate transport system substrate-binding protein
MFRDTFDTMMAGLDRRQFVSGGAALTAALMSGVAARAQDAGKRTVTNFLGTYDIPSEPKRIVLLGNRGDLETALALKLNVVAIGREFAFTGSQSDAVAPWVPFDAAGIEVFDAFEASAEQVLSHEPDLIISRKFAIGYNQARSDALMKLVPIIPTATLRWREDLQQIAEWLGRTDALGTILAEHDSLLDGIKARHAGKLASATVAFGSISPEEAYLSSLDSNAPAAMSLTDLGGRAFALPADVALPDAGWTTISPENVGALAPADALFFWEPVPGNLDQLRSITPLWDRLPQLANGRAVTFGNNINDGSIYTIMQTLRLWDQVYGTLT